MSLINTKCVAHNVLFIFQHSITYLCTCRIILNKLQLNNKKVFELLIIDISDLSVDNQNYG